MHWCTGWFTSSPELWSSSRCDEPSSGERLGWGSGGATQTQSQGQARSSHRSTLHRWKSTSSVHNFLAVFFFLTNQTIQNRNTSICFLFICSFVLACIFLRRVLLQLRRERIAERMKALQELVPNANKVIILFFFFFVTRWLYYLILQSRILDHSS